MTSGQEIIESAITEAERLRKVIAGLRSAQVKSTEYKQLIKATALSWFNNHRPAVANVLGDDEVKPLDDLYRGLLAAAARSTLRTKYLGALKSIKRALASLLADHVLAFSRPPVAPVKITPDTAPDFSAFASDIKMQSILGKRWAECGICVRSNAPLAATVMMGGLLEGLLLARINQLSDKSPVFSAKTAPKDPKTGKTAQLKEWGLKNYIDVAHELGWISKTAKDIGEVVRDYRNYIHPQKELSHGIVIESDDAQTLWEVAKSITLQLLNHS